MDQQKRQELYIKRNENRAYKVLKKSVPQKAIIEPVFYKDIQEDERKEYQDYFQKIWMTPLLHTQRSTSVIQAFWKQILRRSYLANKSKRYQKFVVHYGKHPRQKVSIFTPNGIPETPRKTAMFIHGGYLVNGTEQVFEYLARDYCEQGLILVTIGFRILPQASGHDALYDIDLAYRKIIEVIGNYGGQNTDLVLVTWSGGALNGLPPIYQDREFYNKHIGHIVCLGAPSELEDFEIKLTQAMFDHRHDTDQLYQSYYYDEGPLKQPIDYFIGCQHLQFPNIYKQNIKWLPIYKSRGYDVSLTICQNHDHYELALNTTLVLNKIRQQELRKIKPNDQLSKILFQGPFQIKQSLFEKMGTLKGKNQKAEKNQISNLFQLQKINVNLNSLSKFVLYEGLSPFCPSQTLLLAMNDLAIQNIIRFGSAKQQQFARQAQKTHQLLGFCVDQIGCQGLPDLMGTSATYDPKKNIFILKTQSSFYRKFWYGWNFIIHFAVVFAKVQVKNKSLGVRPFIVPIYDPKTKEILKQVQIQTPKSQYRNSGYLMPGLISFNNYTLPSDSILGGVERFAGNTSLTKDPSLQLGYWQLSISSIAHGIAKSAIYIGLQFTKNRETISESLKIQKQLLDFQANKFFLVPLIAECTMLNLLLIRLRKDFDNKSPTSNALFTISRVKFCDFAASAVAKVIKLTGLFGINNSSRLQQYLKAIIGISLTETAKKTHLTQSCKIFVHQQKKQIERIIIRDIGQLNDIKFLQKLLKQIQQIRKNQLIEIITKLKQQHRTEYQIQSYTIDKQVTEYSRAVLNRVIIESVVKH